MNRSLPFLALAGLLAGCPAEAPDDQPIDTDTGDTDVETDTDVPDTDVPDTDTDVPSNVVAIRDLRLNTGAYVEGQVYTVEGAVVIAVSNVASRRGFLVQDPAQTAFAGLFVGSDTPVLPVAGDVVDVTGVYGEDDLGVPGAVAPAQTLTRLDVATADPATSWTRTGAASLPAPIAVTVSELASAAAESWESMRIRVVERDARRIEVFSGFDGQGTFLVNRLDSSGSRARVASVFRPLADDLEDLAAGDTFAALGGAVWWSDVGHVLAPTAFADLEDYEPAGLDTDVPDTDTDVPDTDTDVPDTDTDTDSYVPDTDSDTFDYSDTDPDTADTDINFLDILIPDLRAGLYEEGDVLSVASVVVTSVRFRTSPVSTNAFTVQAPGALENGGLYVFAGSASTLPAVGDVVSVTGIYQEQPEGVFDRYITLSRLQSGTAYLNTGWQVLNSGTPPAPKVVSIPTLAPATTAKFTAEPLESMLVTVSDPDGFRVLSNPISNPASPAFGDFRVKVNNATAPTELWISSHFFNTQDVYDVDINDLFTSVTGIVYWDGNHYKVAPRSAADWSGFVDL